jgi:hypothetical protein
LNKQLFLAGEVKMIKLITTTIIFLGLMLGSANADQKKLALFI